MKKRVFAGILMMVCILASAVGVSAANSPIKAPVVSEKEESGVSNKKGYYVIKTGSEAWLKEDGSNKPIDVKDDILALNNGTQKLSDLLKDYSEVNKALSGMTALTKVFDLRAVNGGNPINGEHRVVLNVSTLPDNCKEVKVLHYSIEDNRWEIIECKYNKADKTVTVISDDLGPIAIYAATSVIGDGQGTSHPTVGTSSTWMLYIAIGIVALGVGVVAYQKKSH